MCAGSSGDVGPRDCDDEQSVGTGTVLIQVGARRRSVHVTQLKHLKTGKHIRNMEILHFPTKLKTK